MRLPIYLLISCSLVAAMPAQAKKQASIVVTGERPSLPAWSKQVTNVLEQRMKYPSYLSGVEANEGVVRVAFLCSDDGKPSAVQLLNSSGHREIDAAALRAVRQIATLHPLPENMSHSQRYQAVLLFAKSRESYDRQIAAIKQDVERRNAWFGGGGAQVAMGVSLLPAG